jgi:hypothetical protein
MPAGRPRHREHRTPDALQILITGAARHEKPLELLAANRCEGRGQVIGGVHLQPGNQI